VIALSIAVPTVAKADPCCCVPSAPLNRKTGPGALMLVLGATAMAAGVVVAVVGTMKDGEWNDSATIGTVTASAGTGLIGGGIALYVSDTHDQQRKLALAPNGLIGTF
jgi:hypothetical protein